MTLKEIIKKVPNIIGIIITFILINIGWILFRINNLNDISLIINHTSKIGMTEFIASNTDAIFRFNTYATSNFLKFQYNEKIDNKLKEKVLYNIIKKIVLLGISVACISFLASSMYNPFIYFRF